MFITFPIPTTSRVHTTICWLFSQTHLPSDQSEPHNSCDHRRKFLMLFLLVFLSNLSCFPGFDFSKSLCALDTNADATVILFSIFLLAFSATTNRCIKKKICSSDASQTIVSGARQMDYIDNTSKLQGLNYSNWNFRDQIHNKHKLREAKMFFNLHKTIKSTYHKFLYCFGVCLVRQHTYVIQYQRTIKNTSLQTSGSKFLLNISRPCLP